MSATEETATAGAPASIVRSSSVVALGTLLSRVTGFLRLFATGWAIGYGALADTYTLANNTPNIVYELVLGGVLSATLVPVFVHHTEMDDDEGTSAVISVATAGLIALTVVGIVAAPLVMRLYTMTASGEVADHQREVATTLLRLFMPQMLFYGLTAMATALLNARRRFAAPAFAPTLNNLLVMGVLIALVVVHGDHPGLGDVESSTLLLWLLGAGTTAGIVVMTVVLLPAIRRSGFRFRWNLDWRNAAVREVGRMSGWTLGYVIANQVALLVVLLLANREPGGPSTYAAALIFFQLPHALVAVSLMTTIVPELASAHGRGDKVRYRQQFSLGIRLMALIILPAATGYVVLGEPIANVLRIGAVTEGQADQIGANLAMFGLGLFGYSVYLYTLRGFYALRDTRTPFFVNVFENVVNIAAAFALEPLLGVDGLALAYSIAYTAAAAVAVLALRRRVGILDGRRTARSMAPIVLACVLMAGCVAAAVELVGDGNDRLQTVVGVAVGAVVFGAAVLALRVEELDTLRRRLRRTRG